MLGGWRQSPQTPEANNEVCGRRPLHLVIFVIIIVQFNLRSGSYFKSYSCWGLFLLLLELAHVLKLFNFLSLYSYQKSLQPKFIFEFGAIFTSKLLEISRHMFF